MLKTAIILMLFSDVVYASSTGNISVTVCPPPAQIQQNQDGTVQTSGPEPLYCDTDQQGNIICYF